MLHPAKHEVRFRNARLIHGLITRALQDALASEQPALPKNSNASQQKHHSLHRVADQSNQYQVQSHHAKQNEGIGNFGSITSLLHHRYLIVESKQGPLLLDLQLAEQTLRQQQLMHAIKMDTLSSRPILVPIQIPLEQHQLQQLIQHQKILANLEINFQCHNDHIVIESIPSLLSQVDIKQLINAVVTALAHNQTSLEQLSIVLQQQCPLIAIHNLQQAEFLIKQLPSPDKTTNWCHQLDQQTLSSLF